MIHTLTQPATHQQIQDMLEVYSGMIKIVVDVRRGILSGGGEMHADCEMILLDQGSEQDDLWGANWYPAEQQLEYDALINIRPKQGNRSMVIQSEAIRQAVDEIARHLLGGVV
jgi:hypothetical protein